MHPGLKSKPVFLNKCTDDDLDLVPRLRTAAAHCSSREGWVKRGEYFQFASVTMRGSFSLSE